VKERSWKEGSEEAREKIEINLLPYRGNDGETPTLEGSR